MFFKTSMVILRFLKALTAFGRSRVAASPGPEWPLRGFLKKWPFGALLVSQIGRNVLFKEG